MNQRTGYGRTLLHAARKLCRIMFSEAAKPHQFKQGMGAIMVTSYRQIQDLDREQDILKNVTPGV